MVYIYKGDCIITINANSYTIITAHRIKYNKFGFLHTIGNKITGIIIFIGICIFILFKDNIGISIGIYISIFSSLEELIINIIGKNYKENIKGIYEIIVK